MSYIATIRHSSIARTREITVQGSLRQAKRRASAEFGAEQRDYEIVIYEQELGFAPEPVARRRVGDRRWQHLGAWAHLG
jgi:hypothetical protein